MKDAARAECVSYRLSLSLCVVCMCRYLKRLSANQVDSCIGFLAPSLATIIAPHRNARFGIRSSPIG